MGIQSPTMGSESALFETVDRARWTCCEIPHRIIHIARIADMKIKSAKVQILGVQHA